jgi:hypothetical protein
LQVLDERIQAAEELFLTIAPEREIDSQVRLQLELSVPWPDGETQLILKTAE